MTIYDFTATNIDGTPQPLSDYKGQVLLVTNVASKCGFTPQYEGLEKLYETYSDQGLAVLGFPCNQFGHQEPGDEAEIKEFCALTYDVKFPMFAKVDVNGPNVDPLYQWLRGQKGGVLANRIKWNFTKFLVGRDGEVIERFAPMTKPEKLTSDIERALSS